MSKEKKFQLNFLPFPLPKWLFSPTTWGHMATFLIWGSLWQDLANPAWLWDSQFLRYESNWDWGRSNPDNNDNDGEKLGNLNWETYLEHKQAAYLLNSILFVASFLRITIQAHFLARLRPMRRTKPVGGLVFGFEFAQGCASPLSVSSH